MMQTHQIVRPLTIKRLFKRLLEQSRHYFPKDGGPHEAPKNVQGVYIIRKGQIVWHVGRTTRAKNGLWQRLNSHLHGRSSFTDKVFKRHGYKLRNGYTYQYLEVSNDKERGLLEAYAAGCLCPMHFGTAAGDVIQKRN